MDFARYMRFPIVGQVALVGALCIARVAAIGRFCRFAGATFRGFFAFREWVRRDRVGAQLYFIGTTSAPVLALVGGFIGMILAFEGYLQFKSIGQESRLGGVINLALAKQLGPVLAAVMLAGRVGCALAAELGSMRVTEQLDAMRAMAADPVRVLVVPRVFACIVMIPALTIISNLFGVFGGFAVSIGLHKGDAAQYWRYSEFFVDWFSITNGLIKSVFFGAAMGLIACYKGFNCRPGAEGVGRATTDAFVSSFIAVIILDLLLVKLLNDIDLHVIKGGELRSIFK